jgi:hypothetical protein
LQQRISWRHPDRTFRGRHVTEFGTRLDQLLVHPSTIIHQPRRGAFCVASRYALGVTSIAE